MLSVLPHSAAGGPYAAVSPAISSAAARPAYPHCRRRRRPAGGWRRPYPRIFPTTPGVSHTLQTERNRPPAVHRPMRRHSAGKRRIDLHVGGEERGAANKSRIAAEKETDLIPPAVRLPKERHLPRATKGALQCPVPPSGGPCKTRSPFPPRCKIGAAVVPRQAVCPCRRPGPPDRQPPSPPPPPPVERPILPCDPAARNRNHGQTREGAELPPVREG